MAIIKRIASKTFQKDGHWIEKPRRTEILVCSKCDGKYIRTREGQTVCVKCSSLR